MHKVKFLVAVFISLLPFNFMRIFFYKKLLKYQIHNTKIGFGTIIDIDSCSIDNTQIGKFNLFTGPFTFSMHNGSIGSGNVFRCGKWVLENPSKTIVFKHTLRVGKDVTITNKHYFDIAGLIEIGDDSWIAGYASQFWTHGGEKTDNDIIIGKNCYLGSAVRFSPGAQIADNTLVGMGSVVTKKFKDENLMLVGVPALVKKENFHWQKDL